MATTMIDKHIVLHAIPAWGHTKPLTYLAVLIAQARQSVVLTIVVTNILHSKVVAEVAKLTVDIDEAITSRINVVDAFEPVLDPFQLIDFLPIFHALYTGKAFACKSSGKTISGLPPPTAVILDPFAEYALATIRNVAGSDFPLFLWISGPAGAALKFIAPEELGGLGDFLGKIDAEIAKTGKDPMQAGEDVFNATTGEPLKVPGYSDMYDYEAWPQEVNIPQAQPIQRVHRVLPDSTGMFLISSFAFEAESVTAMQNWFGSIGKQLYAVGPLSPPQGKAVLKADDAGVSSFLDRMLEKFGAQSVIYISFGTFFWPENPDRVWAAIDELIVQQTPFVLAHPSPITKIPDEVRLKIANSGIAMEIEWAPQPLILAHPATGWFVTHGGWNSIQESFVNRVPLIFWPHGVDQPLNAARMTLHHRASFELINVRTGARGTRKPYRCGDGPAPQFTIEGVRQELRTLLVSLKGEEGRLVRKNAEDLGAKMAQAWTKEGEARQALELFLHRFVDND